MSSIPNGHYRARAVQAGIGKVDFEGGSDRIYYVWIRFALLDSPYDGRVFEWREPLTDCGLPYFGKALVACGARMLDGDPSDLHGIDRNIVEVELRTVECVEAPGTTQTFVRDVRPSSS